MIIESRRLGIRFVGLYRRHVMRSVSKPLFIAIVLLGWAPTTYAQTVEEVVEKYLTAIGGRAALEKLKSRTITGTITVTTPGGDVSGPVEIINQEPNKTRTLIKLDLSSFGAGQVVLDHRFHGTSSFGIGSL